MFYYNRCRFGVQGCMHTDCFFGGYLFHAEMRCCESPSTSYKIVCLKKAKPTLIKRPSEFEWGQVRFGFKEFVKRLGMLKTQSIRHFTHR